MNLTARVRYGAGRGGFSHARPHPYNGPGGLFGSDPLPAPVQGESPLIPWTGPGFSPPVLKGTRLGNGRGRGQGQGSLKNPPCPRPFSGAGRGVGPGARVFRGAGGPVTNTIDRYLINPNTKYTIVDYLLNNKLWNQARNILNAWTLTMSNLLRSNTTHY